MSIIVDTTTLISVIVGISERKELLKKITNYVMGQCYNSTHHETCEA
jgi:hypothetical protein